MEKLTKETLDMLKGVLNKASISTGTGLVNFDLSPAAKLLYPVLTPLRNSLPRVMGQGDTATRWKSILSADSSGISAVVSEGNRGAAIGVTSVDVFAAYAGLGKEAPVTFEADFAAQGFDDVRALASVQALNSLMIEEEKMILYGNASMALGTCPTPVATLVAGGALTAQADVVYCVALTPEGMLNSSVAGGVAITIAKTNTDATVDTINGGSSAISAASNAVTTAGGNLSVSAHVAPVIGAAGYAWYIGTGTTTAALAAITTINSVLITANPAGTQLANATGLSSDHSKNLLGFDGFFTQALKNGAGYYAALATGTDGTGTQLTSDTAGGIVEIDAALQAFWDNSRLSPTRILVNSQEARSLNKLIIGNGSAPLFRFTSDTGGHGFVGGNQVAQYFNKFAGGQDPLLPIQIHPNMPKGRILFVTDKLPYPVANIPGVAQIKCRRDYYQIDWPLRTRQYEFGVYVDEVLQVFAPFALGVIDNIVKTT